MHKTYDRIEWKFLEKVLERLSFDRTLIKLIMAIPSPLQWTGNGVLYTLEGTTSGGPLVPLSLSSMCGRAH
jgi:hypothetical protein